MTVITVKQRPEANRSENFVLFLNKKENYSVSISDKNRVNGIIAGNKDFPQIEWSELWDDFYMENPEILAVNNICIMTEIVPDTRYTVKRIYQVVSRYNYTPEKINGNSGDILFESDSLESAVNKAVEIGFLNHGLEVCCSLSLTHRKECIENNIKMFGGN
ncbi:MAG: hypothetical protein KAT14_07820 [Candidatus Marinimicrobia bacterium]|nr:hypothetical protein [Candidatus Neomarinimicrobiota bacterium]